MWASERFFVSRSCLRFSSSVMSRICSTMHVSLVSFVKERIQPEVRIQDFRREVTIRKDGMVVSRVFCGDGEFTEVNLGQQSYLSPISKSYKNFRVTSYDKDKMTKYHNLRDHIYVIHKSIMEADVVINIPKLKSHRKAGLTCCLKNSIGINGMKD